MFDMYGRPWLLYGLLACSLGLNLYMVMRSPSSAPEEEPATGASAAPSTEALVAVPAVPAPLPPAPVPQGLQVAEASVEQSLARTFRSVAGDEGDALAQVFARLFIWDVDLRRDLIRGDRVEVAWRKDEQGQIEIVAARLHSNKHGRTFTAYQWQAPGDTFASWWAEDGTEVPFRLQNGPLKDYQQITSLLKDRPTHEGMDFKAPTGSPIVAPRAGVVTRTNWNWSANGNCVEIQFDDGVVAKFLHLDENSVKAGDRVQAGQKVGRTGNTGHSFGPHLHYQVEKGGRVVDPIDYHGTVRRKLDPAANPAFVSEMARLDGLLGQKFVER